MAWTVQELIDELETRDPEAEVRVQGGYVLKDVTEHPIYGFISLTVQEA